MCNCLIHSPDIDDMKRNHDSSNRCWVKQPSLATLLIDRFDDNGAGVATDLGIDYLQITFLITMNLYILMVRIMVIC